MPTRELLRLVLASASPARLRLLRSAGVDPAVVVSRVDEDTIDGPDTAGLCQARADAKAAEVAERLGADRGWAGSACLVLGCDSMLDLDGVALGKPTSPEEAIDRWRGLANASATLLTGHRLVELGTGRTSSGVAATTVRFAGPSRTEIAAYAATGEPVGVAGAFTLEGRGGWFVTAIDGDHGNVLGVSLPLLRRMLGELGYSPIDLWAETNE